MKNNHEVRIKISAEDYEMIDTFHKSHLSFMKKQEFSKLVFIYGIKALMYEISRGLKIFVGKNGIFLDKKN